MSSEDPEWYDKTKLTKAFYASNETGWIIDNGDGTAYLANNPSEDSVAKWGDKVRYIEGDDYGWGRVDLKRVVE